MAKICTKCKVKKPKSEYTKRAASGDGLSPRCKPRRSEDDTRRRKPRKIAIAENTGATTDSLIKGAWV